MDYEKIRKVIIDATKSLTVHDVEVVEAEGIRVHFRIIAEKYANENKTERVLNVLGLIKSYDINFSNDHFFTVDPFTPLEFEQFYDSSGSNSGNTSSTNGVAASAPEL